MGNLLNKFKNIKCNNQNGENRSDDRDMGCRNKRRNENCQPYMHSGDTFPAKRRLLKSDLIDRNPYFKNCCQNCGICLEYLNTWRARNSNQYPNRKRNNQQAANLLGVPARPSVSRPAVARPVCAARLNVARPGVGRPVVIDNAKGQKAVAKPATANKTNTPNSSSNTTNPPK
ncbi:uncharacterized protein LOC124461151 [Drosophila willistoni]|uniref:uncharacterized protein LOC124461151 n=1 Tax=Drosophila willistoni TaxID=7260 RepID=UPI001F07149B|nr:uncharacterized protein LOC124461151 [Drosophila willistoni]